MYVCMYRDSSVIKYKSQNTRGPCTDVCGFNLGRLLQRFDAVIKILHATVNRFIFRISFRVSCCVLKPFADVISSLCMIVSSR